MMRMAVWAAGAVLSLVVTPGLKAQRLVDYWPTSEQCLAATGAPFYYPSISHEEKLAKNEVVRGLAESSCVHMTVPDRSIPGGRAWVRIEQGRPVVYSRSTGKPVRLEECNNPIDNIVPILGAKPLQGAPGLAGPAGPIGPQGPPGPQGPAGQSIVPASHPFPWLPVLGGTALLGGGIWAACHFWWHCGGSSDTEVHVTVLHGMHQVGFTIPIP